MAADRLGSRYELLRSLGSGGMGEVFLVRDLAAGRTCALKRLKPDARLRRAALRREFETLTRLRHPAIVAVYDFALTPDGTPFFTMEYVPGGSPDRLLAAGDWHGVLTVGAEIAHGLEVLHAQGVVHGDLKPSNVLAVPDNRREGSVASVRLVDFGLAAALGDGTTRHRGTSGFAAPEVVRGEPAGVASDLYSLGATLFTIVCRREPFGGEEVAAVLRRQVASGPDRRPLEERGTPKPLIDLILQLLSADPRGRPQTARDVRRELESMDPSIRRSLDARLGSATLVGRERELDAVEGFLRRPLERSRMIIVAGSEGMGKSALLAEIAGRAALAGHPVVRLSGPRLGPVDAIVRSLTGKPGYSEAALDRILDREVESIARGDSGHHHVYIVDQAHSLDELSRRLLRRVLLHTGGRPTFWVLARDTGFPVPDDERTLVDAGLVETRVLPPLDREETTRLVAARIRELPPRRLMDFLWRVGRGHPGTTMESLKLGAEIGAIRESDAGLVVDAEGLERIAISETRWAVRAERLKALPRDARRALEVLTVIGGGTASDVSTVDATVDGAALLRLRDLGLVNVGPGGRYEVSLPVREEDFDPSELRRLHRAALSLAGLLPSERFRHLCGAGEGTAALEAAEEALALVSDPSMSAAAAVLAGSLDPMVEARWCERAAREYFRHGQYKAAVPHLERAVDLDPDRERRTERLYLLSNACLRVGDGDRVGEVVAEALRLDPPASLHSRLLTNESSRLHGQGILEAAEETARLALTTAQSAADPEAITLAAQSLVYILLAQGRASESTDMAEVAAAAALGEEGTAFSRARAGGARGVAAQAEGRYEAALEHYDAALSLARDEGLRAVTEELLMSRSIALCESGRWREFREANAEALRLALEDHRPRNASVAMANLAHADALTGQPRRAYREARNAIRMARRHLPSLEASGWRALAAANRSAGRMSSAERTARRSLELAIERSSADEIGWSRLEYGRVCAERDRWSEALEVWRHGLEDLPSGRTVLACHLAASTAEAALRTGEADEATRWSRQAEDLVRHTPSPLVHAGIQRLKAAIAIGEGRFDEGVQAGAAALAKLKLIPAPAEYASTATGLAELILEDPQARMAPLGEWLEEATSTFERLGNYRGRERALQNLVEWYRRRGDHPAGRPSHASLFDAMSELLASLSDLKELADRAMSLVVEQLSAERGVFLVIDPESGELVPVAERGSPDHAVHDRAIVCSRKVVSQVAESGRSLLITNAPRDPRARTDSIIRLRLQSILCTPLSARGRVVGAVYLDDSRRPRAFNESDQELLEGIAHLLAVAVDRSLGHAEMERTNEVLIGENRTLRREVAARFQTQELVGTSLALQRILPLVERAAATGTTVLLAGESGSGKDLIAKVIHANSKRRHKPFVSINCGAITDSLAESELFGIRSSIATGVRGREGLFRQADGGTLYLDEIGDMPLKQQVALFSAISNREITPVGGGPPIPIDVRIIAATNRDLRQMVEEKTFREELYYRLYVFPIEVPPLRERKADVLPLARHFIGQLAALEKRPVPEMSRALQEALVRSNWPGNVRQLQHYLERVMALTPGPMLYPQPLPDDHGQRAPGRQFGTISQVEDLKRKLVREALQRCDGNQTRAAQELGITEPSMRRLMRKLDLLPDRQKRRIDLKRRMRT